MWNSQEESNIQATSYSEIWTAKQENEHLRRRSWESNSSPDRLAPPVSQSKQMIRHQNRKLSRLSTKIRNRSFQSCGKVVLFIRSHVNTLHTCKDNKTNYFNDGEHSMWHFAARDIPIRRLQTQLPSPSPRPNTWANTRAAYVRTHFHLQRLHTPMTRSGSRRSGCRLSLSKCKFWTDLI